MKRSSKIAAAVVAGALAGSLGLAVPAAHAGPPPPLTERYLLSNEGMTPGNCMDVHNNGIGSVPGVSAACPATGGWYSNWYFDLRGSLYELHPAFNFGDCLTLGTGALYDKIRIEACVSGTAPNQLFEDDLIDSNHDYVIFNESQHFYLNDAHTGNPAQHDLGLIQTCSQTVASGCTWDQA